MFLCACLRKNRDYDPVLYKYRSLLIEVTYFIALKQRKGHFISTYEKIGFINNANTYKMPSFKAIETGFMRKISLHTYIVFKMLQNDQQESMNLTLNCRNISCSFLLPTYISCFHIKYESFPFCEKSLTNTKLVCISRVCK